MNQFREIGLMLVCMIAASQAFAAGLPNNFIHPDKVSKNSLSSHVQKKAVSSDLLPMNSALDLAGDFGSDCSSGCSDSCVTLARRIVNDCGSTVPGNPTTSPDFAGCVTTMTAFFHSRSGTSADQDSADAVSYCVSGAATTCPDDLNNNYFHLRQGTTGDQDRTDAARACQNGVSPACMSVVYPTMHQRASTTGTQDVNDSVAACQRQPIL